MNGKRRTGSVLPSLSMERIATLFLFGALSLVFGISEAQADSSNGSKDVVVFANGDRLSGKLTQATYDSVTFLGDVTKLVSLRWADIREIDLGTQTLCVIGKTVVGSGPSNTFKLDRAVVKVEGSELVFRAQATEIHKMPIDQLLSATPKASNDQETKSEGTSSLQGWGGQLQSQNSLTTSTQRQYQVGGSLHVARVTQSDEAFAHQITSLNLLASYGEAKKPGASPVITQVYEGGLRHDVYMTDNYDDFGNRHWGGARIYLVTDFYHNLSLGMYLEQAYGGGIAWDRQSGTERLGRQKYGLNVDLRYIGEDLYSPGKDQKIIAASFGQNYQIKLNLVKGKPVILAESASVIPAFNNSNALQARGIASLTIPLTTNFSISIQEVDDYLHNAPSKSKTNYSSLQVKFAYAIGAASQ